MSDTPVPPTNTAAPTTGAEPTVPSTDQQTGSVAPAPAPNSAGPTSFSEPTVPSTDQETGMVTPASKVDSEPEPTCSATSDTEELAEPNTVVGAPTDTPTAAPARKVDPMQGMKLEAILHELVGYFGWEEMGYRINIRCFNEDPSIGSSLKFLRKTPWARNKVDALFLTMRAEQSEREEQAEQAP